MEEKKKGQKTGYSLAYQCLIKKGELLTHGLQSSSKVLFSMKLALRFFQIKKNKCIVLSRTD